MPKIVNLYVRKPRALRPGEVYIGHWVTRGWRLPESKWANPFKLGRDGTREEVVAKYEAWFRAQPELIAALPELRGLDLACWCARFPATATSSCAWSRPKPWPAASFNPPSNHAPH